MHRANSIRWAKLWHTLAANSDPIPAYQRITRAYAESHRAYHTLRHIGDCVEELDTARSLAVQPEAVEAAIWYHDLVYDPSAATNETESADLSVRYLLAAGVTPDLAATVGRLILETREHAPEPNTDAALIVDIDLAIFGQSAARFDEYEHTIRDEFFWVEPETYVRRRAAILTRFLDRPFVYSTDFFRLKYEQAARHNLERSLRRLDGLLL